MSHGMIEDPNVQQAAGTDARAGATGGWRSLALSVAVALLLAVAAALVLGGWPLVTGAAGGGAQGCGAGRCCQPGEPVGRAR